MARRHYTPDLANRSLPLVRRIATDVQTTAQRIQSGFKQLQSAEGEDRDRLEATLLTDRDHFEALMGELDQLGVELKDPMSGLLDFRAKRSGEEVYLCWRLGEAAVEHWHTLQGGFAGRRPLDEF